MEQTTVKVRIGTTVNLGDFENYRLDIEVEDFIRPRDGEGKEAFNNAIDRVYNLVEAKLFEKVNPYKKEA